MAPATASRRRPARVDSSSESEPEVEAGPSTTSQTFESETVTLPNYERQQCELNEQLRLKLPSLIKSDASRFLETHMRDLSETLTTIVGEVNDQLTDAKRRYQTSKKRREQVDDGQEDDMPDGMDKESVAAAHAAENDADAKHVEELERRVTALNRVMEEHARGLVDAEVKFSAMKDIIGKMGEATDDGNTQRRNQPRNRKRRLEQEEEDGGGEGDGDCEPNQERNGNAEEIVPVHELFEKKLNERMAQWDSSSLTKRYSTQNTYVGFYRMVHDTKHGGGDDAPPVPHPSTWFSHMESPTDSGTAKGTRATRRGAAGSGTDDDDEIAVRSERLTYRCPITLLPFKDPVTSTKCPHSFEREAIEAMLRSSNKYAPGGNAGAREKVVKCPICETPVSLSCLRRDPVVLRRSQRAMREEQNDESDEEEQDGEGDSDQDGIMSDVQEVGRRQVRVKSEKPQSIARNRSANPGTQFENTTDDPDDIDESEDEEAE